MNRSLVSDKFLLFHLSAYREAVRYDRPFYIIYIYIINSTQNKPSVKSSTV